MVKRNEHDRLRTFGTILVLSSAVAFSLSGVLTRLISSDAWTIVCWRGLFGAVLVAAYVRLRNIDQPLRAVFALGAKGWLLATVGSLASFAFILAFKLTFVGNVVVIYATVPFAAAAFEWFLLSETMRRRTVVAATASFLGVAIMFSQSVGSIHLLGDAVAALMTIGMALYMVLIRALRDVPVVLAGAASALQLFLVSLIFADPTNVSTSDAILLVVFGAVFAIGVILWTEGTRRIAAAEAGLIGSLEAPVAILLAWLILAEVPPIASLVGGAIVLLAVLGHALSDVVQPKSVETTSQIR
jgi:drug/metabolite transporter (DMT)-like permease